MNRLKIQPSMISRKHSFRICVLGIDHYFPLTRKNLKDVTEAEFPLQKNAKPVDLHPYRTNPRAQEVIDKCVENMESVSILEKNPSAQALPLCIVDDTPRFCVDYKTWPMPYIEYHTDTVGGAKFITECDIQKAYWQIPIAKKDCHKIAFICNLERQIRFQGPSLWHRECTLHIPTCHVPCVRQFWPTEWHVGIYGRCYRAFCDVENSYQIIRGYVSRTSNSRADIETIQNSLRTKGSSVPWACFVR